MPSLFHKYNNLLKKYPFRTNMVTTGAFFGIGDACAQYLFPHKDIYTVLNDKGEEVDEIRYHPYNFPRTARAMIYGSFFFAPISVMWHGKTLPRFKNPFVSATRRNAMKNDPKLYPRLHFYDTFFRLSIDQLLIPGFVWIPLYNTVMVTLAMHEHPFDLVYDKLHKNWWNVLKASWTVWPMFQMVNLYFVPVHLRIVTANVWSIGWNGFLSFVHNTQGHGKGSGKLLEEMVDIEDDDEEVTMVYD
ncbi:predicted protein [Scheffersomyces stipitis CBS 6054]|uniref:Protein SYM1 n=1 Tax=Scheffersomyces stipitis (strain ATCC 58785 / CBS 6054 / NBRC 10063 / NRRL Y-11545) TaxID=322104 RepID=A3LVZ9_PICST|nr:predicted protein [Scheffersomyces stipitis CBS 6054]ABN66871.1 predicted protein [Scheffersomyces stipitis CBS 6054]KAG2734827.1 hypothetical protein G9P44_002833 [Scheffersomyces stipitis]